MIVITGINNRPRVTAPAVSLLQSAVSGVAMAAFVIGGLLMMVATS